MRRRYLVALLALMLTLCASASAEVKDIAKSCKFWVSEGTTENIRDDTLRTVWKPEGENPEVRVMLPDEGAAWIQIDWTLPPVNYTFTEYDVDRNPIATHTPEDDKFPCFTQLLPLGDQTRYVSIAFSQEGQGINKILVYPEGELPRTAVQWEEPLDKCDLMVVSTHQDDEWLWFGAIIPYYDLVRNKDVQVVYMANCGRFRYQEALNGLAVAGIHTLPEFIGLKDKYDGSLQESLNTWNGKEAILEAVVEQIRRFKPEVILTHDWKGEYGHPQHILTSRCMEFAIEDAANPERFPESAEKYGVWQVKKLYRHLEEDGRIEFDWHVAYPEFGGRTGIEIATDAMNQHVSQLKSYQVQDHGKYDNALFGLSYSVVGEDVLHDDLFENIPETTTEPTPEPTSEPTDAPADEPTDEPLAASEADNEDEAAPVAAPVDSTELTPEGDDSYDATDAPEDDASDDATDAPEATDGATDAAPVASPEPTPAPEVANERGSSAAPAVIAVTACAAAAAGFLLYRNGRLTRRKSRRRRPAKRSAARPSSTRPGTANPKRPAASGARPKAAPRQAPQRKGKV